MKQTLLTLPLAALLLVAPACGDGPTEPVAGALAVTLTSPNADEGAVLFEITGQGIGILAPADPSYRLFSLPIGAAMVRAVVVGDLSSGALVHFSVPDVGAAASYRATVIEVADRANQLRSRLGEYGLSIGSVGTGP